VKLEENMFTPQHSSKSDPGKKSMRELAADLQTNEEYRKYTDVTEPLLRKAKEDIAENYADKLVMIGLGRNDNERGYPNCVVVGGGLGISSVPDFVDVTDSAGNTHNIPIKKEYCGMAVFAAAFPSPAPGV
jgi:hypothetical protein